MHSRPCLTQSCPAICGNSPIADLVGMYHGQQALNDYHGKCCNFHLSVETARAQLSCERRYRGYVLRREFLRIRRGVIAAQCLWRCKLAKRELRKRRVAARESGKLLQDKQFLEVKVRELQTVLENVQNQRNELRQQYRVSQNSM